MTADDRSVDLHPASDQYGQRHLHAGLDATGALVIDGQDLGHDLPFAGLTGVSEYEYGWVVPEAAVPSLREALDGTAEDDLLIQLQQRFSGRTGNIGGFLAEHGIENHFWNHFSDW
jgi:hypothetical protein